MNLLRKSQQVAWDDGVTLLQDISKDNSELEYIETKVLAMKSGATFTEELSDRELCIVVLEGKISVAASGSAYNDLGTRTSIFEKKPTDSLYLGIQQQYHLAAEQSCKLALCYSPTIVKKKNRVIRASENTIENRGQYANKRLVHTILSDTSTVSDALLVVEVFTESGNWSSYPPHKHDQNNLPDESLLEETYYHEINPQQGFVFQRVYTDDRTLDETMTVETGDVVVVPRGYHPVGVPDGYESYYLNIMAGPIKKWIFHNDPDHEWILERKNENDK